MQPPVTAHRPHQPEHGKGSRGADDGGQKRTLQRVGQKQPWRHAVEAEARFDDELAPPREWQVDLPRSAAAKNQAQTGRQGWPACLPPGGKCIDATPSVSASSKGCFDGEGDEAEANLRYRVIAAFRCAPPMRDAIGEFSGTRSRLAQTWRLPAGEARCG